MHLWYNQDVSPDPLREPTSLLLKYPFTDASLIRTGCISAPISSNNHTTSACPYANARVIQSGCISVLASRQLHNVPSLLAWQDTIYEVPHSSHPTPDSHYVSLLPPRERTWQLPKNHHLWQYFGLRRILWRAHTFDQPQGRHQWTFHLLKHMPRWFPEKMYPASLPKRSTLRSSLLQPRVTWSLLHSLNSPLRPFLVSLCFSPICILYFQWLRSESFCEHLQRCESMYFTSTNLDVGCNFFLFQNCPNWWYIDRPCMHSYVFIKSHDYHFIHEQFQFICELRTQSEFTRHRPISSKQLNRC